MEDLRREKDRLREEKNDILIKLNRHIELEKGEKRGFKSENDRLSLKVRQLENDLSSIYTKIDDKQAEIDRLQKVEEVNTINFIKYFRKMISSAKTTIFEPNKFQDYKPRSETLRIVKCLHKQNYKSIYLRLNFKLTKSIFQRRAESLLYKEKWNHIKKQL